MRVRCSTFVFSYLMTGKQIADRTKSVQIKRPMFVRPSLINRHEVNMHDRGTRPSSCFSDYRNSFDSFRSADFIVYGCTV